MLTFLLIITLVSFEIVSSAESSDDKFINSLPENQKRDFLEKVEERIKNEVPEVKSPEANDTNVDLYEQQLEEQGKSIQTILRTEIDRLKRRSINDTSAYRRSNPNDEDYSHIDLTLRSRKDERRGGNTKIAGKGTSVKTKLVEDKNQEVDVKYIPVQVKYDSESITTEKSSSKVHRKVHDSEVNKANEITWINTKSTKSVDINNNSVDISKVGRRLNNIDTQLNEFGDVMPGSTDYNTSANAAEDSKKDKVNGENSGRSPNTVNETEEVIDLSIKHSDDFLTTETVAVSTTNHNVTSLTENEEDNRTKGNLMKTDYINGNATQDVNTFQNHADISATINSPYSKSYDEEGSLMPESIYTATDVGVSSTEKYLFSVLITDEVNNASHEYYSEKANDSTTKYNVDIDMLQDVQATKHNIDNNKNLNINSGTYGDSTYNNRTADKANGSLIANSNTAHVTNNRPINAAQTSITNAVGSSKTLINIHVTTDAMDVNSNRDNLASTEALNNIKQQNSKAKLANVDHSTIMHNLFGSSLLGNAPYSDNDISTQMNIVSDTTNSILGSTIIGHVNEDIDNNYHTTTVDYINTLIDNLPSSTQLGKVNAPQVAYDDSTTENILNEKTTNNVVGIIKLGNVNPNRHDDEHITTVDSRNIIIDNRSRATMLGDINTEKYEEHQSTTVDTVNAITDLPGSTMLGNVNAEENNLIDVLVPMDQDLPSKVSKTYKIPSNITVIVNILNSNQTERKSKSNTNKESKNSEPSESLSNGTNNKNLGDSSKHFALRMKEDKNMYRVYEVDPNKQFYTPTSTAEHIFDLFKYLKGPQKEAMDQKYNEDDANHPQYVRVYNYDPKNAYFNAYDQGSNGNNDKVKIGRTDPIIVKEIETRSQTTKLDVRVSSSVDTSNPSLKIKDVKDMGKSVSNGNDKFHRDELKSGNGSPNTHTKSSLRIKDVRDRGTPGSIININSDLYDSVSSDNFPNLLNVGVKAIKAKSSEDDMLYEKPLKRGLNKIRKILFNVQNRGSNKNNDEVSDKYLNEREAEIEIENDHTGLSDFQTKYTSPPYVEKHAVGRLTDAFRDIDTQVKKLMDRSEDSKTSTSYTKKDSVGDIYKDIVNSLKKQNRILQNPDIREVIQKLENIEEDKKQKQTNGKYYQSRFQIKDRDEKHLKKDISSSKQENKYRARVVPEDIYVIGKEFKKSKPIQMDDEYLELHVNTLKDLVDKDDVGLEKYDWLGTTVLIQAGIEKLQHIVDTKLHHKRLHPLDHQLLEFVIDLHITAEEVTENNKADEMSLRRLSFPKPKSKKGKSPNTLQRILSDIKKGKTRKRSGHDVNDLEEFLNCLTMGLNDLHTAIKQISLVTTYRNQHWFRNLKQLYLRSAGAKEYLELLLHLTTARLVGLLDDSAKKMVAEDEDFVKKNRASIDRIGVEFMMVLRICKVLEELNY